MGQKQSRQQKKSDNKTTSTSVATGTASNNSNMTEFALKKKRPGCTGMFWRADPTKKTPLASNNDWPRDGATLKGDAIEHDGKKWLLCSHIKQKGDSTWKACPVGAAIPFEYDNHYYLEATS